MNATGAPRPIFAGVLVLAALIGLVAIGSGLLPPGPPDSPGPSSVAVVPGTSPDPGITPAATGPSASATPTLGPSPTGTSTPTITPAPNSSSPQKPAPRQLQSDFGALDGFPAVGEFITAIAAVDAGFVAVGYVPTPSGDCPDRVDGRIWSSSDRRVWIRRDDGAFSGTRLWGLAGTYGSIYAFGYSGSEHCPPPLSGNTVWHSAHGIYWEQVAADAGSVYDHWLDVTVAGGTLVAVGFHGPTERDDAHPAAWTSVDGETWLQGTPDSPGYTGQLDSVAAIGNTVVAFWASGSGYGWYSDDAGRTWRLGTVDNRYEVRSVDLVAGRDDFVAVVTACCGLPFQSVGLAFRSLNGQRWSPGTQPEVDMYGGVTAIRIGNGFLALTNQGETRVSEDGLHWRSGPQGRRLRPTEFIVAAAAGSSELVIVTEELSQGERFQYTWYASLTQFEGTIDLPRAAETPVLGQAYPIELFTHCGPPPIRFAGGTWVVAEIEDAGRGFDNNRDRGTITMLNYDMARYASSRGGSILYERAAEPPPPGMCA